MESNRITANIIGVEARLSRLEARVGRMDLDLDDIVKGASAPKLRMRDIFDADEWNKATNEAKGSWFYGIPINDMDRDELLFVIGRQIKALKMRGDWA